MKQVLLSYASHGHPRTQLHLASKNNHIYVPMSYYVTFVIRFCLLILQEGQSGLEYVAFNCAEASKVATCLNDE